MNKRILVCEFHQETNTFNPFVTPLAWFDPAGRGMEGESAFAGRTEGNLAVHGAVDAIREAGGQAVPAVFMHSGSGGKVGDEVLEYLTDRLTHYLRTETYDAVYLALHGATCTVSEPDACGKLLQTVRELVGTKPVVVSCDLHANITAKMLENADQICGYQTYPHVDYYEVGRRAGSLLMKQLHGAVLCRAAVSVPMLVPPAGFTTNTQPFKGLMDRAKAMVQEGLLEDVSIFVVQPWLDVAEISSCMVAVAKDPETAQQAAQSLADELWNMKQQLVPDLLPVEEILHLAKENQSEKPVILSDPADSPNGGCAGDSPVAAMALLHTGLRSAVCIRDPEGVEQAFRLGAGGSALFSVGGKFTPGMTGPLTAEGTVLYLHPGGGAHPSLGDAAVVRCGTMDVLLCRNGSSTEYPAIYRDLGMPPEDYQLVVVKANTSFRAHYQGLTDLIYAADTPGAGAANLKRLVWHNLPQNLYPFA